MNEEVLLLEQPEETPEAPTLSEVPHEAARHRGLPVSVRMACALALSIATVFCKVGSPEGASRLARWIVGDGSERVQRAFFSMEEALDEGDDLSGAWTVFCQELTDETA